MNRRLAFFALCFLSLPITSFARPGEREYWTGKDLAGDRLTFTNTYGDHWISSINGKKPWNYDTVSSNDDYIELKPTSSDIRVRLYKDKATTLEEGSKFKWFEMATGTWKRL
jgi:hypothetical protein